MTGPVFVNLMPLGVQGAKPPAGARGVPAFSPFPKRWSDDALGARRKNVLEGDGNTMEIEYEQPLRILILAAEIVPFVKVGGFFVELS